MPSTEQVRAWQVVAPGEPERVLALRAKTLPAPPPGMLRIRVEACGVGLPDLLMCRGAYLFAPPHPFTPGQELAGVVLEAGEGARTPVGARVHAVSAFFLGHGGFAEQAWALDDFCFPVPDGMPAAEAAAFLIPYHTAWIGLVRRGALQPGECLLVTGGAGGTGSAAIQLGRALGARVIATARGAERQAFCRALGADAVLDPDDDALGAKLREASGGGGADVVYDTVGGAAYDAAAHAIAHEGRLVLVGFASGDWGRPDPAHMVTHNYSVLGMIPSGYDATFKRDAQQRLVALWRDGQLHVPLETPVPFAELPAALGRLARREVLGKLVVDVATSAGD